MEKYFGNAYRGDPGVPHAEAERFANIWIGATAFSAITYFNPYSIWQLSNQFKNHLLSYPLCSFFMFSNPVLFVKFLWSWLLIEELTIGHRPV
ncbi:hypothetical protein K1719_031755 [Acacia pycnantha]|nr:hypothetical protein K1719_031755 [Acacia pycnantha]